MNRKEHTPHGLPKGILSSHMELEENDPSFGEKFSIETLTQGPNALRSVPTTAQGAPVSAEEGREVLARLKRMAGFESQNFDPVENDVEREYQIHRSKADYRLAEFWRWLLALMIGIIMGILGFLVDWGIEKLNNFKFKTSVAAIQTSGGFWTPYMTYVFISLTYAAVAGSLVSFVEPLAAGSGIAEVKTYLNGIHIKGLLTVKTLLAKLFGVVFSISAGLVAGKEGPFVHSGGIVGGGLGGMGSQSFFTACMQKLPGKFPRRWGGYFRSDADHRDFTAIGTAAGVATAFAAPIGGLLFMVEEGASFYSTSIFWRGFLSTGVGVFTLHFLVEAAQHPSNLLRAHFGRFRDFGLYADSLALYGSRMFYYLWDVPIFCVMGAIGGLMGALWVHVNVKITAFRHRRIPVRSPIMRLLEVLFLVFMTASVWFVITYASPCREMPTPEEMVFYEARQPDKAAYEDEELYGGVGVRDGAQEHFPQLWCKNGTYSAHGQLFFTPLSQALRLVMHLGEPLPEDKSQKEQFNIGTLVLYFLVPYVFMMWTNGAGASTGMFVPALAVGAVGGRLMGQLVKGIVGFVGSDLPVSLTSYSVVGAAAYMGGATRMTLTTTVMVMETTGALQLIVPIMITVFMAKIVGDKFGHGMDDTHMKLRGAPVLDEPALSATQKMIADRLTVSELMTVSIVALPPIVKIRQLIETLQCNNHQAFSVTPDVRRAYSSSEPFDLHGVILRQDLLKLLKLRIGFFHLGPGTDVPSSKASIPTTQQERVRLLEQLENRPIKLRCKAEQDAIIRNLVGPEREMFLDLRPFMQRNPFVVQSDASLSRAYRLFRTMGLRHMFVSQPNPKVIGVITRKDIAEANAKLALGRKANLGLTAHSDQLTQPSTLPFIPYEAYDPTVGRSVDQLSSFDQEIQLSDRLGDMGSSSSLDNPLSNDLERTPRRSRGTRERRYGHQNSGDLSPLIGGAPNSHRLNSI